MKQLQLTNPNLYMPTVHAPPQASRLESICRQLFSTRMVQALVVGTPPLINTVCTLINHCYRYTPTSLGDTVGHVDLVVKVYFADEHPEYPLGGIMSQHMEDMRVGDRVR
jgi:hypothetical protein